MSLGVVALVIICVRAMQSDPPTPTTWVETSSFEQDVAVPLAALEERRARWFRYRTRSGREMRFFAVKNGAGDIRVGLDACHNCYREKRGFRQVGDRLVCNYCGRRFRPDEISPARGGCHPAALGSTADSVRILIPSAELEGGASYF